MITPVLDDADVCSSILDDADVCSTSIETSFDTGKGIVSAKTFSSMLVEVLHGDAMSG